MPDNSGHTCVTAWGLEFWTQAPKGQGSMQIEIAMNFLELEWKITFKNVGVRLKPLFLQNLFLQKFAQQFFPPLYEILLRKYNTQTSKTSQPGKSHF